MKTIVHVCSSVLVRPNGIVRYINEAIAIHKEDGHHTIFLTDSNPTQVINSDETIYWEDVSKYRGVDISDPAHIWLNYDQGVTDSIWYASKKLKIKPDLVVVHDVHSYDAVFSLYDNVVFVQHESDIMFPTGRYSYFTDAYLSRQRSIIANRMRRARIGMTVDNDNLEAVGKVATPFPMAPVPFPGQDVKTKAERLLYVGDGSDRKGAAEFMAMAKEMGLEATCIVHKLDKDLIIFDGAEVHSFELHERDKMFELMSQHKVAYIPAKNECFSLAILECLQFMPVVVDGQYEWTAPTKLAGVTVANGQQEIMKAIVYHLTSEYTPDVLQTWARNSRFAWKELAKNT